MDDLFEFLPNDEAKRFPLDCINAIAEGADLSTVYDQWCAWMLVDPVDGLISISAIACVKQMGDLFVRAGTGDEPSDKQWDDAALHAARAARAVQAARTIKAAAQFISLLRQKT